MQKSTKWHVSWLFLLLFMSKITSVNKHFWIQNYWYFRKFTAIVWHLLFNHWNLLYIHCISTLHSFCIPWYPTVQSYCNPLYNTVPAHWPALYPTKRHCRGTDQHCSPLYRVLTNTVGTVSQCNNILSVLIFKNEKSTLKMHILDKMCIE